MSAPIRPPSPEAPQSAAAHVVLLGLMGTGKTVVAAQLASRVGLPLTDNDAAIGDATELNARQIRERHGTHVLHDLEARHLLGALAATEPTVICAAASVVENESCRRALGRDGLLRIWLRARAETLAARFHDQDHRPVFGDDPLGVFTQQIANRSEHFLALADAIVDVDGLAIPDVVAHVLDIVRAQGRDQAAGRSRTLALELEPDWERPA